jgi:putative endonuclease
MKDHQYFVYMMASKSRVLYIGVTSNLRNRVWEHKNGVLDGFTDDYKCHRLVWYETFVHVGNAIAREKQLKRWSRIKKECLIKLQNPTWEDLAAEWYVRHQYELEQQVPPRASCPAKPLNSLGRDDRL